MAPDGVAAQASVSTALETPEGDPAGRLPFARPLPHVVLGDGLPPLFQEDDGGAEGAEEAEARGALSLEEKFGERRWLRAVSGGGRAPRPL